MPDLTELREDRNYALKKAQEAVEDAKDEGRSLTSDERQMYEKWMSEASDLKKDIQEAKRDQERFERLEQERAELDEPAREPVGRTAFEGDTDTSGDRDKMGEWRRAFGKYLHRGMSDLPQEDADTLYNRVPGYEARESDVVTSTSNVGGVFLPTEVEDQFFDELKAFGGLLDAVDQSPGEVFDFPITTETGRPLEIVLSDDTANTAGHVAENSTIGSVSDISLANRTFYDQTYQSGPLAVSIQSMQDLITAPEGLVTSAIRNRIGRAWARDLIGSTNTTSSTGVQGLITASTGAVEIAQGSSNLSFADIKTLKHSVDPDHRRIDRRWLMTDNTFLEIGKITDADGRFLLQPDHQVGSEDITLLGDPIHIDNSSTKIEFGAGSTGAKVLWYGNFSRFGVRRIRGLEVQRLNELFARNRKVGFLGFVRVDARVMASTGLSADQRPIRCLLEAT